jgi:hypothetical protein
VIATYLLVPNLGSALAGFSGSNQFTFLSAQGDNLAIQFAKTE